MSGDLSATIAPFAAPYRSRILDVRKWALSAGRRVDGDVVGLVIAGKTSWGDEPLDRWVRIDVYANLYSRVPNWCSMHRVLVPADLPEVLWLYLSYLADTGQLTPDSDPLRELRRPLRCYGGLGPDGLPAAANARRVKCVCKVPYQGRPRRSESGTG